MRYAVAPRSVRLERPALDVTLATMRELALESAGGEAADRIVVATTREVDGRDAGAVLEGLARRLRGAVAYTPDGFGGDDVQNLEATLERGGGDCDDFSVALAALALRAGMRAGFAVVLDSAREVGLHVIPVVELEEGGAAVPVELTADVPVGVWPVDPARVELRWLAAPWGGVAGLFDVLVGGVSTILGAKSQEKAAKAAADATKTAAALNASAAQNVAVIEERKAAAERESRERLAVQALDFGRAAVPMLGRMVLIVAAASVAKAALGRRAAPRRRAA